MPGFDKDFFLNFIIENNVVGFFDEPVTLKSGKKSNWYLNWRTVTEDVFLSDKLCDFLLSFIQDSNLIPECFYGVPEGATKLGILSTYKWASSHKDYAKGTYPLCMGRGKPKEHGLPKDRYFLGEPRGKVIILEDVTTTGGSLINEITKLQEMGAEIIAAISLSDREMRDDEGLSVTEKLSKMGVRFLAFSQAHEILPLAIKKLQPVIEIVKSIEKELS
ncbi:MAG: hypothetical protein ABIE74_09565 [Pseudomonadota bacterium]